jgi:hypothetical protein
LPKSARNLRRFIWLVQKPSARWQIGFWHTRSARRYEESHRRPTASDNACQSDAIHGTGHLNVGEDRPDVTPVFQDPDSFISIRSRNDFEAGLLDHFYGAYAYKIFVLNDEHNLPLIRTHFAPALNTR